MFQLFSSQKSWIWENIARQATDPEPEPECPQHHATSFLLKTGPATKYLCQENWNIEWTARRRIENWNGKGKQRSDFALSLWIFASAGSGRGRRVICLKTHSPVTIVICQVCQGWMSSRVVLGTLLLLTRITPRVDVTNDVNVSKRSVACNVKNGVPLP